MNRLVVMPSSPLILSSAPRKRGKGPGAGCGALGRCNSILGGYGRGASKYLSFNSNGLIDRSERSLLYFKSEVEDLLGAL